MLLTMWAVIAIVVLVSALLIYMEHEWGLVLGCSTAAVLVFSYFLAEMMLRTPLVVLLPQGATSRLDAMAIVAGVLLVAALIGIAYLAGRRSAFRKSEPKS